MALPVLSHEIKSTRVHKELAYITALSLFKISSVSTLLGTMLSISYSGTNFLLTLPTSYPYSPPRLSCETLISFPSISDGRDILSHVLSCPWSTAISLYEIVTSIPLFLEQFSLNDPIGTFHLCQPLDFSIWEGKPDMLIQHCFEADPKSLCNIHERSIVVTHSFFLVLSNNPHLVDVGNIVMISHLEGVRRIGKVSGTDLFTLEFKQNIGSFVFRSRNSEKVVEKLMENCRMNRAVSSGGSGLKHVRIYQIVKEIQGLESSDNWNQQQRLMELCQKAVEFYSAAGDKRFEIYLRKVRELFKNKEFVERIHP